jgi:5-methylcytosine-specific restriction endonuclease McrA
MPYRPKDPEKYRDESWLRDKYHSEKLSSAEIAELCDCSKQTILTWMDRHGIEKRSKSEAAKIRAEKHPHTTEAGAKALEEHGVNSWEYWDEKEREEFREKLSKQRSGEDNPMWDVTGEDHHRFEKDKPTHRFYQSKEWKETRQKVLKRDDNECQACGSDEDLHVHHIMPVSAGGSRYDLDNLVTLCDTHHREWEGLYLQPDTRGGE